MTETVAEALSRHEADCPVCQSGYAPHCGERETVEELAELRAELETAKQEIHRWRQAFEPRGVGEQLTAEQVGETVDSIIDRLISAEAERDRYLTRACVAEAKVAKVLELADSLSGEGPYAAAILTAIGGKP